ncbi:winged helix-turn-helix transcriptional regulator [Methanococcoides sp. SA1]|nr:winged helix-turn-helix transcriptional regulator [Methanococcoides sp. SA1]
MKNEISLSLGDEGLKGISEILGSVSAVKILEELAVSDLSVSEIARRLDMKINTVDYNVRKLLRVGLIEKASHWWSVKGRRMVVYRASNRRIVISPKRRMAKKFLWVLGLTGVVGIWLRSLTSDVVRGDMVFDAAPKMEMLAANAGMTERAVGAVQDVGFWAGLAGWEWFLFGAWSAIVLFFVYSLIIERRNK